MAITIAGAVLAGGKASRFNGFPKGLLEISPGITFIRNILQEMEKTGLSLLAVCTNDGNSYGGFQGEVLPDSFSEGGPLAGVESALSHFQNKCDGVLFMPCDLPFMTGAEMDRLITPFREGRSRVIVAQTEDFFLHPLCSVVHIDLLPLVREEMAKGHFKIAPVWRRANPVMVRFEVSRPFINVNSPEDYEKIRWQGIGAGGRGGSL
jgi:molybdenum cofactor guanylyltransferase